ncbi:MAG: hypothetical protein ACYCOU_15925 [Sulfobacillus sp.]
MTKIRAFYRIPPELKFLFREAHYIHSGVEFTVDYRLSPPNINSRDLSPLNLYGYSYNDILLFLDKFFAIYREDVPGDGKPNESGEHKSDLPRRRTLVDDILEMRANQKSQGENILGEEI